MTTQDHTAALREVFEAHIRKTWKVPADYLDWALTMKDGQYQDSRAADQFYGWCAALSTPPAPAEPFDVDALAQEIRRVDGNHSLGAGALAEALMPFLSAPPPQQPAHGQDARDATTRAARDVLAERHRQVHAEGWTPEHDDKHNPGELAEAGACYARAFENQPMPMRWPWEVNWWKPKDRRSNLVRASALLLAEIERLDRAAMSAAQGDQNG